MTKRLLITGATGFIGSQVATLAAQGDWELHVERFDILSPAETERVIARLHPTHLIHLAWYVEPADYWTSRANVGWADGTIRLFRCFARQGGQRLVGIGTSAEYDWSGEGLLHELSTPRFPATLYGESKKRVGEEAAAICRDHGISGSWARLFMVYGPGEPPTRFVPTAIRALLEGRTVRCADPVARDFIHVRDAARALLTLAGTRVEGAVNVGSGSATTLRRVAELIGARVDPYATASDVPLVVADTTRLREEVGFAPQIPLEQGLRESVEWWRERYRK